MNEKKKKNCLKNDLVIKKECSLDIYTKILECSIIIYHLQNTVLSVNILSKNLVMY